eukprot:39188_1
MRKYETRLSGNINKKTQRDDNCYHVITYNEELTLDRITISDGYANLQTYGTSDTSDTSDTLHKYGGAMITIKGSKSTQLYLKNVNFRKNYALAGGALWFMANDQLQGNVNAMISNCIFQNNYAINGQYEGGYGGAIYTYFYANVTVSNTKFVQNKAEYRGGAIYQDYGGIFSCDGCAFIKNEAKHGYGGGIFSEDRNSQTEGTFPVITKSRFFKNKAKLYGGAICWFNGVHGTFEKTNKFIQNEAAIGGAIALIWSDLNVTKGTLTFDDNKAKDKKYKDTADYYNISETLFRQIDHELNLDIPTFLTQLSDTFSQIRHDRDLYGYYPKQTPISERNICFVSESDVSMQIKRGLKDGSSWQKAHSDLQDCLDKLKQTGGEIWVKSGIYTPSVVPEWKLKLNKTTAIYKSFILYENITLYGGFIGTETEVKERDFAANPTILSCKLNNGYCRQLMMAADNTIIDGFIFKDSQNDGSSDKRRLYTQSTGGANSISVEDVLTSTSTVVGAGIYTNSTNIMVTNSIFYKLFSKGKGGAVYCVGLEDETGVPCDYKIKYPSFVNVMFLGNRAAKRGGAIAADANCHFTCDHCIFESNSCSTKGGAVYLDFDSDPRITNSKWIDNYAKESGGACAADGASYVTFDGITQFINNAAVSEGGALYSGSGAGPGYYQGFSFHGDTFDANTLFKDNHLKNKESGQDDIYLWPYSTLNLAIEPITPAPTFPPTKATPSPTPFQYNQKSPNVIIFVIDDWLYTKQWEFMAPNPILDGKVIKYLDIPTPHIDSIRSEGVTFPGTYVSAPKCSPSRFSILTGRHASRSIWGISRTMATSSGVVGTNVSIQLSKITDNDGIFNIPYELQNKEINPYRTGVVGKWHLMTADDNGFQYGCDSLNNFPNATLYEMCTNIVKQQGFDFVDAYYHGNIEERSLYGHNPEWMISSAQKFITQSVTDNKPFFLYMAHTLAHSPDAKTSLFDYDIAETPKGKLNRHEIPTDTSMKDRCDIWRDAMELGFEDEKDLDYAAACLWIDDSLGALIRYLKTLGNDIYNNTMIIVMNDHGQGSKGTIYEQGIRTFQYIRYPKLFEPNIILNENFVVSAVDLASVIFDITNTNVNENYILDSRNWIDD